MDQLQLPAPTPAAPCRIPAALPDVIGAWLDGMAPTTARGYSRDLESFARFAGLPSPAAAVDHLLGLDAGAAHALALHYRNHLLGRDLASATIARHLAALRSVTKLGRQLGRVAWSLEVKGPKVEARRDNRGPDADGFAKLWKAAKKIPGAIGARNRAAIALLFGLALRRAELLGLALADVDMEAGTVKVVGKGSREPSPLTIPENCRVPLNEWLMVRGNDPGPLFTRLDRAGTGGLSGEGLADMLSTLGERAKVGRRVLPHGLRHSAITAALDAGNDIRAVRKFSRHAKLETVLRYDDERQKLAEKVAKSVGKALK